MGEVFIGSEAIAANGLTRHELQRWHRPLFRGVYLSRGVTATLRDRATAAWLASDRRGVVAGLAASALHGASWVDADIPIELISTRSRRQRGLVVRDEAIEDDEITWACKLPVTTRIRTAFDLGRYVPREQAVARLDALMRVQRFSTDDVLLLAERYRGARGLKSLRQVLPLVDGGAASPQESRLRLLYIDARLPPPETQIPVVDERGRVVRVLDLGWRKFMVGSEYDGDRHRTDRRQYATDVRVMRKLKDLGWLVRQVIKEDSPYEIVEQARAALVARGWRPS